jgi:hypothetical protein
MAATPNTSPIYPRVPISWIASLKTEVCNRDPGAAVPKTLGTAGSSGALIESIQIHYLGTEASAKVVRLYSRAEGTTTYRLIREVDVAAQASAAAALAPITFTLPAILPASNTGLRLAPGEELSVGISAVSDNGYNVVVRGGQYA